MIVFALEFIVCIAQWKQWHKTYNLSVTGAHPAALWAAVIGLIF
jgi:uncharacterized membrane protein